jgi:4-methylaminobutanoate oxidase (formaldehyde-forming)
MTFPSKAQIVVIGGGIVGCSTAFHLARDHNADVVLIEQGKLTNGSTWHAAGLVGQLRSSAAITQVLKYSVELYEGLEAETGLATGWKQNGGLRLANNEERWIEIKRQATTARSFGLQMDLLTPKEAQDLWPMMDVSDLVGAAFMPTDGQASPSDITQSLARGARMNGAKILEGVTVKEITVRNGTVTGVVTDHGTIECEKLVNCAGMWAKQVGQLAGVSVPLQPVQHQYMVTEPMKGTTADLPTLRDPDRLIYFKEEVGGLVMGGYERNPMSWAKKGLPEGFEFQLLESDWDHFEQLMEQALIRVPGLETAGVKQLLNGPESFTPDGTYIMGEAPEVKNFFVGAGFNAFGIAAGGGAGWTLAQWVMTGEQPMDLWSVDIRRFSFLHHDNDWVRERTLEAYGKHYTIVFPHEEYESGRPRIVSPLYDRIKAKNACFGSKLGWERPNWFAPEGVEPKDQYAMGKQNWFDHVGNEHKACRDSVVMFDQSSFAKFELRGKDAERALSWIAANDVTGPVGKLTYTQMLNSRGGIECDLTCARLADDLYYIVTGTGYRTHDGAWIRQHIPAGLDAELVDITEDYGTLSLFGPDARKVLEAVTSDDISHQGFAFGSVKNITIAGHTIYALRMTYVGELGWELHMPIAAAGDAFDAIFAAGQKFGIKPAGYRAIESLRLEKGYRAWGSDITPNDNPFEAGLGWAVKLKTGQKFLGREAMEKATTQPLPKRLAGFTLDDPEIVLVGRETILRNGQPVGYLTSGGYGYTLGKPIGYGYIKNTDGVSIDYINEGTYELEVACQRYPARVHMKPLYDPQMQRIKA